MSAAFTAAEVLFQDAFVIFGGSRYLPALCREAWLAMGREAVREMEEDYRTEVMGKPVRSFLSRLVGGRPDWQTDLQEDTSA